MNEYKYKSMINRKINHATKMKHKEKINLGKKMSGDALNDLEELLTQMNVEKRMQIEKLKIEKRYCIQTANEQKI